VSDSAGHGGGAGKRVRRFSSIGKESSGGTLAVILWKNVVGGREAGSGESGHLALS